MQERPFPQWQSEPRSVLAGHLAAVLASKASALTTHIRLRSGHGQQSLLLVARWIFFSTIVGCLSVCALFSVLVGCLLWLIVVRAWDRREVERWIIVLAVIGCLIYGIWVWQTSPFPVFWHTVTFDVGRHLWHALLITLAEVWAYNGLLAPLCALLLAALYPSRKQRTPCGSSSIREMVLATYEKAAREGRITVEQALLTFAAMTTQGLQQEKEAFTLSVQFPLKQAATSIPLESLGSYEGGELSEWIHAGQLCLSPTVLRMHGIVIGEPGYGKTVTLIRLLAIARCYGRKVIYLDLKGSRKTATHFLAAMQLLRTPRVKMYPQEAYDGWRGGPQALFNRLMEQIDPKTHPFYRAGVGSTVVSLAVHAPEGPPRNSKEFLERLDATWLRRAYAADAQALREIHAVKEHIGGLALIFAGFFRGVAGGLNGTWAFEDTDAAYIGIDGTAHKEEAASMGRYLLEDAANYATSRKDLDDQVLLIIDEFGVLRSTNATDLYERVREAGMSVYTAAQSYEALGIERNNLLAAAAVKILHRTGDPVHFIKYAGEREIPQFSRYINGRDNLETELPPATNQRAGAGNRPDAIMSQRTAYAIRVEDVQQLGIGQIAVIYGGRGAFAQVTPLAIPETLETAAQRFLTTPMPSTHLLSLSKPEPEPKPEGATTPSSTANFFN